VVEERFVQIEADVIVITAGRGQLPGETRLELINGNAKIMKSIIESMGSDINPDAKIVVVANPCDPLTYYARKLLPDLPEKQCYQSRSRTRRASASSRSRPSSASRAPRPF
jgi:malate/lactate dehydrogenase